jgi:hypothetical protein
LFDGRQRELYLSTSAAGGTPTPLSGGQPAVIAAETLGVVGVRDRGSPKLADGRLFHRDLSPKRRVPDFALK